MIEKIIQSIGRNCVDSNDGIMLAARIQPELNLNHEVVLDFESVEIYSTPFFNGLVGPLIRNNDDNKLNNLIKWENFDADGNGLLRKAIVNSQKYFAEKRIEAETKKIKDDVGI